MCEGSWTWIYPSNLAFLIEIHTELWKIWPAEERINLNVLPEIIRTSSEIMVIWES